MKKMILITALMMASLGAYGKTITLTPKAYKKATVIISAEAFEVTGGLSYNVVSVKKEICRFTARVPVYEYLNPVTDINSKDDLDLYDPEEVLPPQKGCITTVMGKEVLVYLEGALVLKGNIQLKNNKYSHKNGVGTHYSAGLAVAPKTNTFTWEVSDKKSGRKEVVEHIDSNYEFDRQVMQYAFMDAVVFGDIQKIILKSTSDILGYCDKWKNLGFENEEQCLNSGIQRFTSEVVIE